MTLSYHTATTGTAAGSPQHTAEPDPPRAQTARWAQPCPAWKAPWMGLGCGDVGAVTGGGWDVAEGVLSRYILPATSQPCCSACFDLGMLRLAGLQWLPCPREPLGCPELGWCGGTGSCVTADTLGTGGWLLPNPLGWGGVGRRLLEASRVPWRGGPGDKAARWLRACAGLGARPQCRRLPVRLLPGVRPQVSCEVR